MCRYEDFEKVLIVYKSVLEDLANGQIDWDNDKYFREWEMHQNNKISKVCQNNKEEYENVMIDFEDNEMQSFYGDEILEVEKTGDLFEEYISNAGQDKLLKTEKLVTKGKDQTQEKKEGLTKHEFKLLKYKCKDCNDPKLRLTNAKALKRHIFTVHEVHEAL